MLNQVTIFKSSDADAQKIVFPNTEMDMCMSLDDNEIKLERFHLGEICPQMHESTLSEYWSNRKNPQRLMHLKGSDHWKI